MSEIITENNNFVEQKCCITFEGKTFCSGGSWLCTNAKTGKMHGILYESEKTGEVISWDGSIRIPAFYGTKEWRDNFGGKRSHVWFKYAGRYFIGHWYGKEWSQIVRCYEITKKSYEG
jgi:hypothetical protein